MGGEKQPRSGRQAPRRSAHGGAGAPKSALPARHGSSALSFSFVQAGIWALQWPRQLWCPNPAKRANRRRAGSRRAGPGRGAKAS